MKPSPVIIFVLIAIGCRCALSINVHEHMHPTPKDEKDPRSKREESKFHTNSFESTTNYWQAEAQKRLRMQLENKPNTNVAKNLIMFLGDGMSTSTVSAARIYFGQKLGFSGEESLLSFEEFPHLGLSKVGSHVWASDKRNLFALLSTDVLR